MVQSVIDSDPLGTGGGVKLPPSISRVESEIYFMPARHKVKKIIWFYTCRVLISFFTGIFVFRQQFISVV